MNDEINMLHFWPIQLRHALRRAFVAAPGAVAEDLNLEERHLFNAAPFDLAASAAETGRE